jgi:hypothetical protein
MTETSKDSRRILIEKSEGGISNLDGKYISG